MDYEKLISETLKGKIGEFVVTNSKGDILYRNHAEDFTDENWKMWADINLDSECLDHDEVWEVSDRKNGKAFRIHTVPVTKDLSGNLVHHVYNTSDYANLLRDVSGYSKEWRKLINSTFSTDNKNIRMNYFDKM